MASSKDLLPRVAPDCSAKCRSKKDAARLIAAISKCSDEREALAYLCLGGVCSQPGRVADKYGRSLLHVAASKGMKRVAEWLLKHMDASLNGKDQISGYTALHKSILYGQVHVADFLLSLGANANLNDNEGLSPLDLIVKDRGADEGNSSAPSSNDPCDVYTWGSNTNFNLGIGHQQMRTSPDLLEFFRKEGTHIRKILLQKFHSAFISSSGQIYTCGHGRGGRLGHGHEEAQLTPKAINAFSGQSCSSVALGVDHSVFLLSSGSVWTCGTNAHHQLGQHPPPKQSTTPVQVSSGGKGGKASASKFPPAIGVGASRYHSIFWTKDCVFTWGLNAGQLGHLKGEQFISVPKLVTALNEKQIKIKLVSSSEGAIVVVTEGGEIIALHEYKTRRIATRYHDIAKIEVIGGHLDSKASFNTGGEFGSKIVERGGQDLKVIVLTNMGRVLVWQENRGSQLFPCVFNLNREIWINDMAVSRNSVMLLSKNGFGYEGIHHAKGKTQSTGNKSEGSSLSSFLAKNQTDVIKIKRIPGIFRGSAVACDPKGQNFCVLQIQPNASLFEVPEIEAPSIAKDMRTFLDEASEYDALHDLVVVAGGERFPAHKFVLSSASDILSKQIVALPAGEKELVIENVHQDIFRQMLQYSYTKTCDLMKVGKCDVRFQLETKVAALEVSSNGNDVNDNVPNGQNISAFAVNQGKKGKRDKKSPEKTEKETSGVATNPLQALQIAAKLLGFHGLLKSLDYFKHVNGSIMLKEPKKEPRAQPCFSRKSFPELHDATIKTEDGVMISCHKSILSARLEYFRSMFGMGWAETALNNETLSLPVHSKVVYVLLEFIYRDEAANVVNSDDPEFVSNVLVIADQFLIPRLIQICESQLCSLLSLKNVAEILQFAFDFNAKQLQTSSLQFVCQNLEALLESRVLESLSDEVKESLRDFYLESTPRAKARRILPYSDGPSKQEIEQFCASYEDVEIEEILLDEAQHAANMNAKKRNQKRRNSSGDKIGRRRNMSSSSISSNNSDSGSDCDGAKNDESNLSGDDFDFEEKEPISMHAAAPSTPLKPNGLNNANGSNGEILANFFGAKPEQSYTNNNNVSSGSKKFGKKSQKERKKEQLNLSREPEEISPKPQWTGWGKSPDQPSSTIQVPSVPSLSDIMKTESKSKAVSIPGSKQKDSAKPPRKASWRQLSFTEDVSSPPPPAVSSPWKTLPEAAATATSPQQPSVWGKAAPSTFKDILSDQVQQSENLIRAKMKPLSVTQAEERAIEELRKFYNVDNTFDESITVARVEQGPVAVPYWNRHKNNV